MNFKEKSLDIENKEKEPFAADLRVDFVRHGQPSYTQVELESAEFEGELTKIGIEQVKKEAAALAAEIDKDRELVVIWESPKARARQTAKIIKKVFGQKGIQILRSSAWKSLSDVKATPEFFKQVKDAGTTGNWMEYWTEAEDLPAGTETSADVKKRTERVITYLERIARTVQPANGRKLHFIIPSHEETPRDLLEEAYGMGTKAGSGPVCGESVRVDITKSGENQDATLKISYVGQPDVELGFSVKEREFHKYEK